MTVNTSPAQLMDSLAAAAVLGTDRAAVVPTSDSSLGKLLGGLEAESPEARFLLSAGVVAIYTAAGSRPGTTVSTSLAAVPDDDTVPASVQSGSHLHQIIASREPALLIDWSRAAARAGRRVPDEVLPVILDSCAREVHEPWVDEVLPALGARGLWLAQANPEWSTVAADFDALCRRWPEATASARSKLMRWLRRLDPARARDLLMASIADEAADDRAAQLAALEIGLSVADEPFLERSLDDSSKVVRAGAADLLARIAGSELGVRMAQRARELVKIEQKKKLLGKTTLVLDVELPETSKEMTRDGVESRKYETLGNKAWMLAQMIGMTPLATWAEIPGATPAMLIAAAAKTEWVEPLLCGWSIAAGRQRNAAWCGELARAILALDTLPLPLLVDRLSALIAPLDPASREKIVGGDLAERRDALTDSPIWKVLLACNHAWSGAFTTTVLQALGHHFKRIAGGWDPALDTAAAIHIAVSASLPAAVRETPGWSSLDAGHSPSTRRWISSLLSFVQLRREYLKELSS